MSEPRKRILLVDLNDSRRDTRVQLLTNAGYSVAVRDDHISAENIADEGEFDLVVVALHRGPEDDDASSERLSQKDPTLPILLLTDSGVFVPPGTFSRPLESGSPLELIREVTAMLAGSTHIREIRTKA
jgi:hypothetical protein